MSLPETMKAMCFYRYGTPEELVIVDLPVPVPEKDEVLIKTRATAFSPADAKARMGWYRPMYELQFPRIPGIEIAGTIAAVGEDVTEFKVGDKVIGFGDKRIGGSHAEYCRMKAGFCAKAPEKVALEDCAAIPGYCLTAAQALTEEAHVKAGDRVLVIGAGGGVGQLGVQMAKYLGAYVIGCDVAVCEAGILENGADEFIPAGSQELFDKLTDNKVDVIFSVATFIEPQFEEYMKILKTGGTFVSTVPIKDKVYEGPDYDGKKGHVSLCLSKECEEKYGVSCRWMTVQRGTERLNRIVKLLDDGAMHQIVSKTITLNEYKQLNYEWEEGKVRGRYLILVEGHI